MNRDDLKTFLRRLVGRNTDVVDRGEWVSTHCPLSRWTHARGTDRSMSFGVKVNVFGESIYNCYSCPKQYRNGPLKRLVRVLESFTGDDYREVIEDLDNTEILGGSLPEWDDRVMCDSVVHPLGPPISPDFLDIYEPATGHPYLARRGISEGTIRDLDLRVDYSDSQGAERILFPVFNPKGEFYGYTGRAVDDGVEPRVRDYLGLPKRYMLLGSDLIEASDPYIILVEGLFDFARLYQYGASVVAAMHAGVTPQQANVLKELNRPVLVMLDNDKAGAEGTKIVKEELGKHLTLLKVRYPKDVKDPGVLTEKQYKAMVKDFRLLN